MVSNDRNLLHPLTTHWHNRSLSSVVSDAATFHSAQAHQSPMELSRFDSPRPTSPFASTTRPLSPHKMAPSPTPLSQPQQNSINIPISPKLESMAMNRQDSGFAEGRASTSSRRTSTSSSRRPVRRTTTGSSRPSNKRAPRSSPTSVQSRYSTPLYRPTIRSRHTTPTAPYEFFQFPTLPSTQPADDVSAPHPPPPATCQYWTSEANRRLEYAAIDAASRGVRGFFIKLVPDCILPPSSRRTRFHSDTESDAGSVRRYRLSLPEEKTGAGRPGMLKRWTSFGRRTSERAGSRS